MKISTSQSETMFLCWKSVGCSLQGGSLSVSGSCSWVMGKKGSVTRTDGGDEGPEVEGNALDYQVIYGNAVRLWLTHWSNSHEEVGRPEGARSRAAFSSCWKESVEVVCFGRLLGASPLLGWDPAVDPVFLRGVASRECLKRSWNMLICRGLSGIPCNWSR